VTVPGTVKVFPKNWTPDTTGRKVQGQHAYVDLVHKSMATINHWFEWPSLK